MTGPLERTSSKTALGVAALRAIHVLLDGEPKILDDTVAGPLLGTEAMERIRAEPDKARTPFTMGLRAHVILRSRFTEERLAAAVQRGVRQMVVLGAGYDTFAYRQPDWARGLRIFEVDHRGTQEDKRRRLDAAGIALPENLEFVAIDFEKVSLREGLQASSLNFAEPAFFSCLGVLMYLTREAADAVFQLAASFPADSEIGFTFSTAQSVQTPFAAKAAEMGEPWQNFYEWPELERQLGALGFSELTFLRPTDAEQLYFQGRSDGLHAPLRSGIAAAIVGRGM